MDVRTRRRLVDIVAGVAGLTIGWLLRDPVAGAFGSFLGYLIGVAIETWAVDRIRGPESVTTSSPGKTWYEAAPPRTRKRVPPRQVSVVRLPRTHPHLLRHTRSQPATPPHERPCATTAPARTRTVLPTTGFLALRS